MRSTRGPSSAGATPRRRRPKATFSNTVMCGNSAYDWNTRPRFRRWTATRVISSPDRMICPPSGSTRPATIRRSVLLPQPDGPRRDRNSPGAASSETSSTATTAPNDLRSRRTVRAGAALLNPLAGTGASARDLAPPPLGPFGELLRHEVRVGEVHGLDERAVGDELHQIGGQL